MMTPRLPQLESLRVFEASARHGNFSRAASELGVTPAAVSLRVRQLEIELGQSLFVRSGPRISLTETGKELADRMGQMMALARAAVANCRSSAAPLRITVAPTFAARWLGPRLPLYQALPDASPVRLDVSTELRPGAEFDLAIRSGHGEWPGMVATHLLPLERTPMLSPELARRLSVRSPSDLQKLPLAPDDNWRTWFEEVGISDPELNFLGIEYPSQEMEAWAALDGIAVALLSPTLFAPFVFEGRLCRPFDHVSNSGEAYYVLRHEQDNRLSVDHFLQWLCAQVRG